MLNHLKRFVKDESGAAAIEYGLITSGISVAIIPGVKDVGTKLVAIFTAIQHALYSARAKLERSDRSMTL
jgi:Flp pilus assembly pilin Flp